MRHRYEAFVGLLLCLSAHGEPWSTSVGFEPVKAFERIELANDSRPVSTTMTFPAIERKAGHRLVLRFQARCHSDAPSGCNPYLAIALNGEHLAAFTADGSPRLLNRRPFLDFELHGRMEQRPYWGTVQSMSMALLTFFGPGGDQLDTRNKSDREERYWYVVDVSDRVSYLETGLDAQILHDTPNTLAITNNLVTGLIGGAQLPLVVEDLTLGYLSSRDWKAKVSESLPPISPLAEPLTLPGESFEVRIGRSGAMHLVKGVDRYAIESSFSFPGDTIGRHALSPADKSWRPTVRVNEGAATIEARGAFYALRRTVRPDGPRLRITDSLTNVGDEPVGILIAHTLGAADVFSQCLLSGTNETAVKTVAENPSVFVKAGDSACALLAEDNVGRLQFAASALPSRVVARVSNFALDAGKTYGFEWTVYTFDGTADYWTFINQVREDWDVNFTIDGPWEFFHVQKQRYLLDNPERLRKYLERKNLKIVALSPWLEHDNLNWDTNDLTTRDEYRTLLRDAAKVFREVDPDIRLTGCMESFPILLTMEGSRQLESRLPYVRGSYYDRVPPAMLEGVETTVPLTDELRDCLTVDRDGRYIVLRVQRGPKKPPALISCLIAYPKVGNAKHEQVMDQARFITEEVGLDGIYIDCFSMAFGDPKFAYSYDRWDGTTVDIDSATGRITRKYLDAGLVGATSRGVLCRYLVDSGKVMVANSYAVCRETQSLPVFRFSESEYEFDPLALDEGETPPMFTRMTGGQLSSPIGLGYRPVRLRPRDKGNIARIINKSAIVYLRHGGVGYHYYTEIPESGAGSGEYGIFNHMFPITPLEINAGFIRGRERTITCVSGVYDWVHPAKPVVHLFDIDGRAVAHGITPTRRGVGWRIDIELRDWEQVAVIE